MLSLAMTLSMAACSMFSGGGSDDASEEIDAEEMTPEEMDEAYDNGIEFEEEAEGAKLTFKSSSKEDFYGSWESTSGHSIYMYGNIDLKITADGSWTGNVAGEDISGKWTFEDPTLTLSSELFNATLSFTKDGKLILQEIREDSDEPINTVLTKK
jgi:hypothetical protein